MPSRTLLQLAGRTILLLLIMAESEPIATVGAASVDQLADLTGRASAVVTLKARDNFTNEFRYDVSVKNQSADPVETDSLVVVLDQITDLAGKDALDRIEVVGQDGETADGKPYFRIPAAAPELAPYSQSKPVTVILKNSAYTIIFTPSFKVRGLRRLPPSKAPESVQSLIDLLIKKGVLSEEEGAGISKRAPANQPPP